MNNWFPPEWHEQDAVQLTWPHIDSDWYSNFDDAQNCFIEIAKAILQFQSLIVVAKNKAEVEALLGNDYPFPVFYFEIDSNDSWARDHAPLCVKSGNDWVLLDFIFNGWGNKFEATLDNQISKRLKELGAFGNKKLLSVDFILEGGSIESNGANTVLTTSKCLLNPNRNHEVSKAQVEKVLKEHLGAEAILWLNHGELAGDDTDAHIDTLARFIAKDKIAYVKCDNPIDPHFDELNKMEQELKSFKQTDGKSFELIPLPMTSPKIQKEEKYQLPATYANFLFVNGGLLLPIYNCTQDKIAIETMQKALPHLKIVPIDCSALIEQHGSLHCVTMQYPKGTVQKNAETEA
jgi:agmatine deiminase